MARSLLGSGMALDLQFLLCVDDDNSTVKVFKSQNSSGSDNTANVNSDMTRAGNLAVSTMSWNGYTVPYMYNNTDYGGITFGTNKPYLKTPTSGVGTYFGIIRTPSVNNVGSFLMGGTVNPSVGINIHFFSSNWYATLKRLDNNVMAYSTAGYVAVNSDETWAHVHPYADGATERFYAGQAGSTLSQNNTDTAASPQWSIAADLSWAVSIDVNRSWTSSSGRVIMIGAFNSERSLADLQALHADPFGTLFTSAAPSGLPYTEYNTHAFNESCIINPFSR